MRVRPKPLEKPRVVDATLERAPMDAPTTAQPALPLPLAPGFAGVPVPTGGATTTASVRTRGVERPQAEWSGRAREIAADAVAAAKGKRGTQALEALVDDVLASPELAGATVSLALAKAGAVVVTRGTDAPVNPCSNAKLVTAAYALHALGPMHRFTTDVAQAPDGTLVISGGFDPTLTSASLLELARAIAASGITRVPRVVVDNGALEGTNVPAGFAQYGDEDWDYLARPEPFSVNKNMLHLAVAPGIEGGPAVVTADQGTFAIRSRVTTVAAGEFTVGCDEKDNGGVLERDASGKAIVDVWGTIAAGYRGPKGVGKELAMKSPVPTESSLDHVARAFAAAGIVVDGGILAGAPVSGAVSVHAHKSEPLATILQTSLAKSNAFDHEMLALAAAQKESGGPVSLSSTAKRLDAFLHDVLGAERSAAVGAERSAAVGAAGAMPNASGIGNDNRLRAQDIVRLLALATTDARYAPLVDALAQPGRDGTLKGRMLDTPAEGAFRGKTGTGRKAVALSGLVESSHGALAVSLLAIRIGNREGARAALDGLAIALSTLS